MKRYKFYKLGLSNRAIGRQLGVNHQTINNELNRG
ncbi:helix-turn-helix domain-containing protein, partial [Limosilactobacillus pulli]